MFQVLLIVVVSVASAQASASSRNVLKGVVATVIDADRFVLRDRSGNIHQVMISDIDAPEEGQEGYRDAKQLLESLILGRRVRVVVRPELDYAVGVVGRVYAKKLDVARAMVKAGWAWVYREYSDDEGLVKLEGWAMMKGLGVWRDPAPTPPWAF